MQKKIQLPLRIEDIESLKAGDRVLLSGTVYTGRDAAHKRMVEQEKEGIPLPIELQDQVLYYTGPTPAKPGEVIGSAGPTTSGRMDLYTPALLEKGLKGMIGKGYRSEEVIASMLKHKAVYFGAVGGAAALIARSIKKAEVIAYEDLGTEAIRKLIIEDFPVFVINDIYGGDIYKDEIAKYKQ
ncbi:MULTISPECIES: Fe-S-containing hydro-lyase [Planococcus]|uniref:Fumarate hydratase n=2 Tax=Planococcus TaxID=1372 RepID=A0A1B1S284_9BACL|nr:MULTISPECIES: Fe-S-containing hydro-lyase [Planococcus]ANU27292.1 fumarate hydratase [Planococcus versutus]AQU80500.1 fumarate hydratase [Planococcus faecalis]OHX52130.1 fumarate hydratase [Planococcus faecalis]